MSNGQDDDDDKLFYIIILSFIHRKNQSKIEMKCKCYLNIFLLYVVVNSSKLTHFWTPKWVKEK